MAKFLINAETGCLEWQGSLDKAGYGLMQWQGRQHRVHRVVWELLHGPIAPGYCVCHHCDNPRCGNSLHLFTGTRADNNRDKAKKGRAQRLYGITNGRGKLTAAQIIEIRARYTRPADAPILAGEYGVSRPTIINIVKGRRRAVVTV